MTTFFDGPKPLSLRWMMTFLLPIPSGAAEWVITLVDPTSPTSANAAVEISATAPAIAIHSEAFVPLQHRYALLTTGGFPRFPLLLHCVSLFRNKNGALVSHKNCAVGFFTRGAHGDDALRRARLRFAFRENLAFGIDRVVDKDRRAELDVGPAEIGDRLLADIGDAHPGHH